jgi:hypothetical protein
VEIKNFRCIGQVEIEFDNVTTFIGPNGAGKSTVLRAVNWFFNGEKSELLEADVYDGAQPDNRKIEVKVEFCNLTPNDRQALGAKYVPPDVDTFTAWRTWEDGVDKFTGKARALPQFEVVREAEGAATKKAALRRIRDEWDGPELPLWTSAAATADAMDDWERQHPHLLAESRVSDTHFFGFQGRNKLSGFLTSCLSRRICAQLRKSPMGARRLSVESWRRP